MAGGGDGGAGSGGATRAPIEERPLSLRYDDAGLEARRKALVETMAGKDRAPQQLKSAPRSLAHTYGCFFRPCSGQDGRGTEGQPRVVLHRKQHLRAQGRIV
jgi:hypothetical protein